MKNIKMFFDKFLTKDVPKAIKIQRRIAIGVVVTFLLIFVAVYLRYGKSIYTTLCEKENLQAFLARFGCFDEVAFVAIRAFQTVIKIIPAEPLELAAGAFYGTFGGLALCSLGSLIGSLIIILITKKIGRKVVNLFVPLDVVENFDIFKNKKRMYSAIFLIFLIPSSPKDLMVYAASLTNINIWKFLLVTTIARIPNIILSTWCGAEFINENYNTAIMIFVATIILAFVLSVAFKKYTSNKAGNGGASDEAGEEIELEK